MTIDTLTLNSSDHLNGRQELITPAMFNDGIHEMFWPGSLDRKPDYELGIRNLNGLTMVAAGYGETAHGLGNMTKDFVQDRIRYAKRMLIGINEQRRSNGQGQLNVWYGQFGESGQYGYLRHVYIKTGKSISQGWGNGTTTATVFLRGNKDDVFAMATRFEQRIGQHSGYFDLNTIENK